MLELINWRQWTALAALMCLGLGWLTYHGASQAQVTRLEAGDGTIIPIMLAGGGVGLLAAWDVPIRLIQRLVLIAVGSLALFLAGESFRGLTVGGMYDGPLTRSTEYWPVLPGSKPGTINARSQEAARVFKFDYDGADNGLGFVGRCVRVAVETNANGDKRLAEPGRTIKASDIQYC